MVIQLSALVVSLFASTLALSGGVCIDRSGATVSNCVAVVTRDGVSMSASPLPKSQAQQVRTIDVSGMWIVPGFVDNHVHLGSTKADPDVWTRAGVTELVENGSRLTPDELSRRFAHGPRIYACGPIITHTGGYPAIGDPDAPALEVSGALDAGRKTAVLIRKQHPASIKIAIERGFLSDLSDEGWPALAVDEVRAIVTEAHRHGIEVRAHVTQRLEFDLAVDAGVDVIAHSPIEPLTDSSLRRAAAAGVVIVSTAALWPEENGLEHAAVTNLARYAGMGGPIALGSDYPNWKTPGLPIAELRLLNEAGMTPAQLLVALTRHTVRSSRPDRDLVVLRRNPLEAIDALTDVALVIRDGVIVYQRPER